LTHARTAAAAGPALRTVAQARLVAVVGVIAAVTGACGVGNPPSVWVDNRSAEAATFFVDGLSLDAGPYYIVPPRTSAHVASPGVSARATFA
jgi:hypothetical protein